MFASYSGAAIVPSKPGHYSDVDSDRPPARAPLERLPSQTILELGLPQPPPQPQQSSKATAESFRKHRPHRRSNSGSGLIEGGGVTSNRWSQSTSSSGTSNRTSFVKRLSLGNGAPFANSSPQKHDMPSHHKQYHRPAPLDLNHSPRKLTTGPPPLPGMPSPMSSQPMRHMRDSPGLVPSWEMSKPVGAPVLNGHRAQPKIPRTPIYTEHDLHAERNTDTSISPDSTLLSPADSRSSRDRTGFARERNSKGSLGSSAKSDRQPSQKAMLSSALQKAHTAVLLDNAQNFGGAMNAYSEACGLLQQVMHRNTGDEEKRKLQNIWESYDQRIKELRNLSPQFSLEKELPKRPVSSITQSPPYTATKILLNQQQTADEAEDHVESGEDTEEELEDEMLMLGEDEDDDDEGILEMAATARIANDQQYHVGMASRTLAPSLVPPRRESLMPSPFTEQNYIVYNGIVSRTPLGETFNLGRSPRQENFSHPQPLAKEPVLPQITTITIKDPHITSPTDSSLSSVVSPQQHFAPDQHSRDTSTETMSWLNTTVEESAPSSSASSFHSRASIRRHKHSAAEERHPGFDAAMDAAVEAAYADADLESHLEPHHEPEPESSSHQIVSNVRRNVELAKERVREAEREHAIEIAKEQEKKRLMQARMQRKMSVDTEYNDEEAAEEERMLEEMTKDYVLGDFDFGLPSKSALPRESDSSSFSRSTGGSTGTSISLIQSTALSPVAESRAFPKMPPPHAPPTMPLPRPPNGAPSVHAPPAHPPPSGAPPPLPLPNPAGIRNRRTSLQGKVLTIETTTSQAPATTPPQPQLQIQPQPPAAPPPKVPASSDVASPGSAQSHQSSNSIGRRPSAGMLTLLPQAPAMARGTSSPLVGTSEKKLSPENPPKSPGKLGGNLRQVYSSSSLRARQIASSENSGNRSPITPHALTPSTGPFSSTTSLSYRKESIPALPTQTFLPPAGGTYLFNHEIHQGGEPGVANLRVGGDLPISLEPCPTEHNLRPFWLMRCMYETIANPHGGYVTQALFIPREAWCVKNVKLKNVEDKIANCRAITGALQKLGKVDMDDADAVLEEMQAMEPVLDKAQTALAKKLGSEVGASGTAAMFKDANPGIDLNNGEALAKANPTRSYLSWGKKFRGKTNGTTSNASSPKDAKDMYSFASLPMTQSPTKAPRRNTDGVQCPGPNAAYMSALAALFDAAQVLDQIARQVEDPGLKHSSQTQVGLELSTRHAAEFFALYVCRFVLADISVLIDKYVKRGGEWVNV